MQNKIARGLTIAAFICTVLTFLVPLSLLFLLPPIEDPRSKYSSSIDTLIVLIPLVLMATGILLIIVAIRLRESRGDGLAMGAFYCSSFPLIYIICFCYFFLSEKAPRFSMLLLDFPLIFALPFGIIALILAIIALIGRELGEKKLAVVAVVISALGLVFCLLFFHPAVKKKTEADSCGPYIYSFDGKDYMLDSEPYAGAILIEQTRYSELNHLVSVNGRYHLKMTNELDEIQYTDGIQLIIVGHPIGTDVVVDVTGLIHTVSSPFSPSRACELPGTDILALLGEKDGLFWESGQSSGSLENILGRCKEIILEFPKPQNAKKAKLVMNVSNTLLSSSMAARFLEVFGNCYPVMYAARSWAREGLIRFEVQAWENDKWITKGWTRGASPHLPKDVVSVLDVSAITGQYLKIRLLPATGFWRIDSAVIDYSDDVPISITTLEIAEAINHNGQDIKKPLKDNDNSFYVSKKGDYAVITFAEPPLVSKMARSFILKASGYYTFHTTDFEQK